MLVLSIFPGIDMLGRGFEAEGFCVVRGPDLLWGGDIRDFYPPAGRFEGVIAGSPCQDFSRARRSEPTGYGLEMLEEFARVVTEASPDWFLLENVPTVPSVTVPGYTIQRFDLNANECGLLQRRLRHFQFGSRDGIIIVCDRRHTPGVEPTCMATEGKKTKRRAWPDFCALQGLARNFDLPGWSIAAKYAAVGNGVPLPMARTIARAIRDAHFRSIDVRLCICGCGRIVSGKQISATPACRKRMQRRRDTVGVTAPARSQGTTSQRDRAEHVTLRAVTAPTQSQSL